RVMADSLGGRTSRATTARDERETPTAAELARPRNDFAQPRPSLPAFARRFKSLAAGRRPARVCDPPLNESGAPSRDVLLRGRLLSATRLERLGLLDGELDGRTAPGREVGGEARFDALLD